MRWTAPRHVSVRRAVVLLALVLAVAGCGGGDESVSSQREADAAVQNLENVLALRSDFEADAGKTRVILLLSPT